MHYRDLYTKKEAEHLVFAIQNSCVSFYDVDNDKVFAKILEDVEENEYKRCHCFDEEPGIPDEAPFIQGDGLRAGLPDIIYEGETFVLGIEDFEFDSAKKTRKGSKLRMAIIDADKELEEKNWVFDEDRQSKEVMVNVDFSYENYVNSLLEAFQSHAKKIENYRKAMGKYYPNKKIYFAFYMEDITAIGSYIKTKDGINPIYPLFIKEVLDEVSKNSGIDYIMSRVQDFYIPTLCIQQINSKTLQRLYENVYDIKTDQYILYNFKRTVHSHSAKRIADKEQSEKK